MKITLSQDQGGRPMMDPRMMDSRMMGPGGMGPMGGPGGPMGKNFY